MGSEQACPDSPVQQRVQHRLFVCSLPQQHGEALLCGLQGLSLAFPGGLSPVFFSGP